MRPPANGAYRPMRQKTGVRGLISENRRSWLRLDRFTVIMYRFPGSFLGSLPEGARQVKEYEPLIDEHGDEVVLFFESNGRKLSVNLTEFTADELQAFREYIDKACVRAQPIVDARDRIAEEMLNEHGDDSHTRLYRGLPQLHVRKGEVLEHNEGVRERSSYTTDVVRVFPVTPVPPVHGSEVAERDEGDERTGDDGPTTGGGQGVREVGGPGPGPF